MLVQPIITDPTPAGRAAAYNDWRQEMLQANSSILGLDLSRRAFDAAAVYQPRTVADLEAEILAHHGHVISHEGQIRDQWKIRRRRMQDEKAGHAWPRSMAETIRGQIRCIRWRQELIRKLNAEVEAIETTPPRETFSHHAAIAAE